MTKYTDAKERLVVLTTSVIRQYRDPLHLVDKRYNNNLLSGTICEKPVLFVCGRFLINCVEIVLVTVPDYTHYLDEVSTRLGAPKNREIISFFHLRITEHNMIQKLYYKYVCSIKHYFGF